MKKSEAGQGLVEYALILVLVAIVVIAIMRLLGPTIGNTFSTINSCLDGVGGVPCDEEEETASSRLNSLSQTQLTAQADENELLRIQIEILESAAIEQEESLHKAFSELGLGLNGSLTVLIAQAQATGDDELVQTLTTLQQELQAGNYEALPEALAALNLAFFSAPFEVQVAVAEAVGESSVAACKELAGAAVSPELYQAAVAALNEREAEAPGSTGQALPLLQAAWNEIIEPRNQASVEGEAALETLITLLINGLEATDEIELLKLAQKFSLKADGCGSLPNIAPTVQTGPDHTVAVDQADKVTGRWKDSAGHLDEPYTWAWDLDGDGAWDSEGTSAYGPTLEETVSFGQPGSYTLSLMVTDKDGASDVSSLLVVVEE